LRVSILKYSLFEERMWIIIIDNIGSTNKRDHHDISEILLSGAKHYSPKSIADLRVIFCWWILCCQW